jgi:hydrogenase nickel incorporation protein HypA/HybF
MHEYPVTVRIIEIATEYAVENKVQDIRQINLVVGDYCGYVSGSIELYFPIIAEGTACSNARLNITRVKPKLKCNSCGELFEKQLFSFECPYCGGEGGPTEIGKEFYIKSIEI